MSFVSVTRLRVRKYRFLPGFGYYTLLSFIQGWRAEGNLRILALRDRRLTFWTITVWRDADAMKSFRNSGAHRLAMSWLSEWCDEATYLHWQQESDQPPGLKLAHTRLVAEGVVSRVKYPSPDHAARRFEAPPE